MKLPKTGWWKIKNDNQRKVNRGRKTIIKGDNPNESENLDNMRICSQLSAVMR